MGVLKRSRRGCFSFDACEECGVFEFPAIAMVDSYVVAITLSFFYIRLMGLFQFLLHVLLLHPSNH